MGDLGSELSPAGGEAHLGLGENICNVWHFEIIKEDDTTGCKRRKGTEEDRQR